ncbi:hypothetical protein ACWGR3_28915 [Streptomyces albidoflavus]
MNTIAKWFTDAKRQAIQAAIAAVMPLLVLSGALLDAQVEVVLVAAGAVLQLAQGFVGLSLLRRSDAARWFGTVGRGLIYALAAAVGPLGVAFRWWGDDTAAAILTVTGLALTALAAVVQIVNVQTVDALPDPATATRREYQSALEREEG